MDDAVMKDAEMNSRRPFACFFFATGILIASVSGCAGNPFKSAPQAQARPLESMTQPVAPVANNGGVSAPTFRVTMFPVGGEPIPRDMVFDGSMTINKAAAQAGAWEKFKNVKLSLVRGGQQRQRHKMKVELDSRTNRVDPRYDYAIRPGDHVMVHEDMSTPFDKMIEEINPF